MKKHGKGLLQVIMMLGVVAFVGTTGYAGTSMMKQVVAAEPSEGENELSDVDLSKGVEYLYNETGESLIGINLNGNSVIIQKSANSTDSVTYNNIYIDKDRDGVLDDDEKQMVSLNDTTDIIAGPTIYGVYKQRTETPIRITMNSGFVPVVYGVYQGEMTVADENAITLTVNDGEVPGAWYGAYESELQVTNGSAAAWGIHGGVFSTNGCITGLQASNATVTNASVVTMDITGGSSFGTVFMSNASNVVVNGAGFADLKISSTYTGSIGTLMAAYGGEVVVKNATVAGIQYDIKGGTIGNFFAVNSVNYELTGTSAAAIDYDMSGGSISSLQLVYAGSVTADGTHDVLLDIDVTAGTLAQFRCSYGATLHAGSNQKNVIDMDITGSGRITGELVGIYGVSNVTDEKPAIQAVGNIDINCDLETFPESQNNIYNLYGTYYYVELDGSVNVYLNNVRGNSFYGVYGSWVKGSLTMNNTENTQCSYLYGMYGSAVDGDFTMNAYGVPETSNSYCYVYGCSSIYPGKDYVVGGEYNFKYKGGLANYVYAAYCYGSSGVYYKIKGNVNATIEAGTITGYAYGIQYANALKDYTFTIENKCCVQNGIYVSENSIVEGNANISIKNNNTSNKMVYCYGLYSTSVYGNVDYLIDGGYYYQFYGVYSWSSNGNVVKGDLTMNFKNINPDYENLSSGNYSYGSCGVTVLGTTKITMSDINCYTVYGLSGGTYAGDVTVDMDDIKAYYNIYGMSTGPVGGNVEVTMDDSSARYVYGVQSDSGEWTGTVSSVLTNVASTDSLYGINVYNAKYSKDATVKLVNCSGKYSYGVNGIISDANVDVVLSGGTYGTGSYGSTYGANYTSAKGNTKVTIDGAIIASSLYPYWYRTNDIEHGDVDIDITGLTLSESSSGGSLYLSNYLTDNQTLTMDIDDSSVIPESTYIYPSYTNTGTATATYKGAIYYGGMHQFDQNVEVDTAYFTSGYYYIPEGVTFKADELYYNGGSLLLEGTLDAPFAGTVSDEGKYANSVVYMNGGSMTQSLETIGTVYYPVTLNVSEKGGTVNLTAALGKHYYGGEQLFSYVGATAKLTITIDEGYSLTQATTAFEDEAAADMAVSGSVYSFVMAAKPCTIDVVIMGNPIVIGKTVADPVAKLNTIYTAEEPIYDLTTVSISNDALNGEVTFEVDATNGLPEGLVLEDNKIYGTPTVAYESGKRTTIHVTGKNGYVVDMVLNIVVTAGDSKQENQDGRIIVDDENKMIYLSGNSIVVETQENQTAIYLDDDRNGTADYETPAYVGDLTSYTVYGVRNTDVREKIRITMNGGTIGTIYGAYNGKILKDGAGLEVYINAGSVGKFYGLYNASVLDTMKFVVGTDATLTASNFLATSGSCSYEGYYYNNRGTVNLNGTYTLDENIDTAQVNVSGELTIPEGFIVNATKMTKNYGCKIYLKGSLNVTTMSGSGYIFMMGGTVPENNWSYVYYPVTLTTSMAKTTLSVSSYIQSIAENEVTTYYLPANYSIPVTMTAVEGYDYYYSVDGSELTNASSNSFQFTMPAKSINIHGEYVAKQISVEKHFAEPTAVLNKKYTTASPLYDLTALEVLNDTDVSHGNAMTYAVKSGSALPNGLSLQDGKVIGTPTVKNEAGATVSFVVTGRNGTSAIVDVVIVVVDESYVPVDINKDITAYTSAIYLKGHSIVIVQDPADSAKSIIYPDYNHDGLADNNIPLVINGYRSYDLSGSTIYGYNDNQVAYDGDISITLQGGNVFRIYGVYGSSSVNKTVVNGDVNINISGGKISSTSGYVYGLYNAKVENLNFNLTDGHFTYADFYGAYQSEISGDYAMVCGNKVKFTGGSSSSKYVKFYSLYYSTVGGNVDYTIGALNSSYGFVSSYTYFYGMYNSSKVLGNMNLTIDGYWYPRSDNYLVNGGTIEKDMNVRWKSGSYAVNSTFLTYSTTIKGDCNLEVDEGATVSGSNLYVLYGSTADNLYINVPDSVNGTVSMSPMYSGASVNGSAYMYNKGAVYLGGTYEINEDLVATSLSLLDGAKVTVAENAVVNVGALSVGANVTLNNYGTLNHTGQMSIGSGAWFVNRDNATYSGTGRLNNSGTIVNFGDFTNTAKTSSYYKYFGNLYTTKQLQLYSAVSSYANYANIYYAVDVQYPRHLVESVTVSGTYVVSSGLEGDTNQYILEKQSFTVTPGTTKSDAFTLASVTYGSAQNSAVEQSDGTWTGTGTLEPLTISLNYEAVEEVEKIELETTTATIENTEENKPLVVGNSFSYSEPLYDLTTIKILNDIEGEGEVVYSVDSSSALPKGLYLRYGRLYGTITLASAQPQEIKFVVKGKNQTSAFFTLTLGAIVKNVPDWNIPTGLQTTIGKTLADVYVPYSSYGSYSWVDGTQSVGNEVTTLNDIAMKFTPNDTTNYDWETAATNAGATYSNGVISFTVSVKVCAGIPTYVVPEAVKATYGQTLGDLVIPSGDNDGTFTWEKALTTSVGAVGEKYFYATYTPNNTENYTVIRNIRIKVVVQKAIPTYEKLESVSQDCGFTLGDIVLPEVEGGTYQWITTSSTIPIDGTQYQVGFKPTDMSNYDWTALDDWNNAWNCVVFPVTVNLNHTYASTWAYDAEYHWHPCLDSDCQGVQNKDAHQWDSGTVITEATEESDGEIEYKCMCGAVKTVVIPAVVHTHVYGSWLQDENSHWQECACGEEINAALHAYDAGVVVQAATTTEEGIMKYTCTVCGYTMQEDIPMLEEEDEEEVDEEEDLEVGTPIEDITGDYEVADEDAIDYFDGDEDLADEEDEEEESDDMPSVVYNGPSDPDATIVIVPDTITVGEVTYKVTVIADEAFKNNKKLTKVTIGNNIKKIGASAFENCTKLKTISFKKPSKLVTIGEKAFYKCTSLTSVTIPESVKKLGDSAFDGCKKLKTVTFAKKSKLKKIGKKTFNNCVVLKKISIPENTISIGDSAFAGCKKMTTVTLTKKAELTAIGKKAFSKCVALKKMTITDKVTTIDANAFEGCTAMTTLTIGKVVKNIGAKAFYNCKKLKTITITSTKLTAKTVGKQAFTKAGSSYYSKMVVKVPKKQFKTYKSILIKAGLSKKAKLIKK